MLEAAVRAVLQQPEGPLLGVDIAALTQIYAADVGIVSLSGIECATGLVSLTLSFNEIADIGPLAGLTQLEVLNLRSNPVADFAPLAGLTALRELVLDGAVAADVSPLAAAKQLELLDIAWAPIDSLAPLAGLSALRELSAPGGAYLDIEALAALGSLVTLDISNTAVTDLGPLADLASLESLTMNGIDVADLGPLTGLPIRRLYANGALVEDLSPVATFPTPLALELMDNGIVEADALLTADWSVPGPDQDCLDVILTDNPLSAVARGEVLPAFCAASGAYVAADGLLACTGHSCIMP
ncbi:leucine-rich repeat domain-containing protein [Nannocystis bainbridge]|uniref:Leucine-rich repeat domain-containing protein n=1 Tax=Nannocystis bainbridge TaxID=2995303 RepID=A0ABT5E722_9BACT|nr:leucine-rich repeat domain-containing protein [Nannocystis bainbridge]MDC0721657.1 leucine-rich repeat domain-containing protein [Nannocystis bainbridge]